jgi:hypothetical protein
VLPLVVVGQPVLRIRPGAPVRLLLAKAVPAVAAAVVTRALPVEPAVRVVIVAAVAAVAARVEPEQGPQVVQVAAVKCR